MKGIAPPVGFIESAEAMGLVFDDGDVDRLAVHLERVLETNRHMNLTAVTEPALAWERHVLDSLTLVAPLTEAIERAESEGRAPTAIDVGSGAGYPGIPLAVVLPQLRMVLLEATGKKARFLAETLTALGLTNVQVVNGRAEVAGQDPAHRERHDVVIARAVGPLPILLELTVPLARVGGLVLAIKGEKAEAEIESARRALHMLHASIAGTVRTPTGTIVAIEKRRPTPKAYPRRPGEPKRSPL